MVFFCIDTDGLLDIDVILPFIIWLIHEMWPVVLPISLSKFRSIGIEIQVIGDFLNYLFS